MFPSARRPRAVSPLVLTVTLAVLTAVVRPALACTGDCDGDGTVAVNEAVRGVAIALGQTTLAMCPSYDRNGSGTVTVDELLQAINAVLGGCPATPVPTGSSSTTPTVVMTQTMAVPTQTTVSTVSATPTRTPTPTSSSTPTESPTPTATVNQPPQLSTASIYRAYEGFEVQLPVATDPEGATLQCNADMLPAGAVLDGTLLRWTPSHDQLGPQYLPLSCSDPAVPPGVTAGELIFKVQPVDSCITPACDPASGCTPTLPPLSPRCCTDTPIPRVAEPAAGCPEGRAVFIGANVSGFGRLQDCDVMFVRNFAQSSAQMSFHVETRCLATDNRIEVEVRIETAHRLVVNAISPQFFTPAADGFARKRSIPFLVMGPVPYFDIEQDGEANVTVTARDSEGNSATTRLRVRLSFNRPDDLPDVDPTPIPSPANP